ncbi:MAG: DEAD/DEAH box helicase [bacterium]|nr:DEAD/DEAH box helicase [bacterium]
MNSINRIKSFIQSRFKFELSARFRLSKTAGSFAPFPGSLVPALKSALSDQGIQSLYTHQEEAFRAISANSNTLLVSKTASGKTFSFFLPILNEYINAPLPFSVLLLYPTKALARDQEKTLARLMSMAGKPGKLGTFDGDTPREERSRILRSADFIITNPDMLHFGILPNHAKNWRLFLSRLRYIVIDEVHVYRGAFGSHVSNVFSRLLRVCAVHGSSPVFVCSSATVGNPGSHALALTGKKFHVIDRDCSPRGDKSFYFLNPALVENYGTPLFRKSTASLAIPLLREAAARKIRTICFCRARQEVEQLHRAVVSGFPDLAPVVKPYRGGLLPSERRQLEHDLSSGSITVIISTNALELGIDIGDLDLCILSGHPGTLASFWQQAGRVGRGGKEAVIVYIAKDRPIDQYLVTHPEFVTGAPVEHALCNRDNPYILLQHLSCAALELPLLEQEPLYDPLPFREALSVLTENGSLVPRNDSFHYALKNYPARDVSLRSSISDSVQILWGSEVIGKIDSSGARGSLYPEAIYHHLGRKFLSLDLDLKNNLCSVKPVSADYFTEAVWEGKIDMVASECVKTHNNARLEFGVVNVNRQPVSFKKIKEVSFEISGYGTISLPPLEYKTTGFNLSAPPNWRDAVNAENPCFVDAAFHGLSYVLKHAAILFSMSDSDDINTDISLCEVNPGSFSDALFLFDTIEGGVGYAEKIFEEIDDCLALCAQIIDRCECEKGCPSCVPPLPPGVDDKDLQLFLVESNAAVVCSRSLLLALSSGSIEIPRVSSSVIPLPQKIALSNDPESLRMRQKLNRASGILQDRLKRVS